MVVNTGAAILGRVIDPEKADLTPEAARSILRLDFARQDHKRMAELQSKASAGTLSANEHTELDEYLRVANWLALWQSKARLSLKRQGKRR
jgi:hypothetical protein